MACTSPSRLGAVRHCSRRAEGQEELGVEEAGAVRAVVRAPLLGGGGDDLGELQQHAADAVHRGVALLEGDGARHGGADPEVALLQRRQELGAERREQEDRAGEQRGGQRQAQAARPHGQPVERAGGARRSAAHQQGVALLAVLAQQRGGERRGDGEGRQQRADDGVGVGLRHRAEDAALDAAQREQRDEGGDDDEGGEEDRLVHLARRAQHDQRQAREAPGARGGTARRPPWARARPRWR